MKVQTITSTFIAVLISFLSFTCGFSQGYYKDLSMDSGVGCAHYTDLPAADILNLTYEYIATGDISVQNNVILSNPYDENGVYNGTVEGAVSNDGNGTISQGYWFDGTNDYIYNNTGLFSTYPVTLSAWIKTDNAGQTIVWTGDKDAASTYFTIEVLHKYSRK